MKNRGRHKKSNTSNSITDLSILIDMMINKDTEIRWSNFYGVIESRSIKYCDTPSCKSPSFISALTHAITHKNGWKGFLELTYNNKVYTVDLSKFKK